MEIENYGYVTRNWEKDKERLAHYLDSRVLELERRTQIFIFPEGTNLSQNTMSKSRKFAEANNLPNYSHVLHPKTTGFAYLTHHLQVKAINFFFLYSTNHSQ